MQRYAHRLLLDDALPRPGTCPVHAEASQAQGRAEVAEAVEQSLAEQPPRLRMRADAWLMRADATAWHRQHLRAEEVRLRAASAALARSAAARAAEASKRLEETAASSLAHALPSPATQPIARNAKRHEIARET